MVITHRLVFTPHDMANDSPSLEFHFTEQISWLYHVLNSLTKITGTFLSSSFLNRPLCKTLIVKCFTSIKKCTIHFRDHEIGVPVPLAAGGRVASLCTLPGPGSTQPSILSGSVNEYRLRLGRYKAGMCDAAWCAPCT